MTKKDTLLHAVQEIVFREWDPIGVNDNPACRDEYDSYAPTICRYLLGGADEHKIARHLSQLQTVSMGLSVVDEEHNPRVANRLLGLVR